MNFIKENERIYLKDKNGSVVAEIEFKEVKRGTFDIYHTFVDESIRGQGVAAQLVQEAVNEIKARGGKVEASCSYAKKCLDKDKKWSNEKYKQFLKDLKSKQDLKYKEFHSSLVLNSKYEMIGIRVPTMRDIAKKIAKESDIESFIKFSQDKYYEEVMIQGLVISHIKDETTFDKYFREYINKIDNWALCDSFCSSIKIVRKNEKKYFKQAIKLSINENEFLSRVGLVMILDHFISENNLQTIFETLNIIQSDKFYINMAEAWLVCEIFIKHPKETEVFLKKNNLNRFTQNKAISKIHDSYRVSKDKKELINKYKK